MEAAVASVLNKVLGEWLEDLNSDQLNLSVWSGKIRLGPIKVKNDALDKFGLPFQVRYGYVRTISVDVDWLRLTSKPLIINIEDVFLFIGTRPSAHWNEETELHSQQTSKESDLQEFEIMNSEAFSVASDPGFIEKLVTKIVDNLQVKIQGVYIRLEDEEASIQPFAVGVVLGKVQAVTCNAQWKPQFVEGSSVTYKHALIENVSLFLDSGASVLLSRAQPGTPLPTAFQSLAESETRQRFSSSHHYLLAPAAIDLKVVLNKDHDNFTKPILDATLVIGSTDAIQLGVETPQLTHILKLIEFYATFSKFKAGILANVAPSKWSQAESDSYRTVYKEWYRSKGDSRISATLMTRLTALEREHLYEEIVSQRVFAQKELQMEQKEALIQSEIEKHKEAPSGLISGMKGLFGWGESTSAAEERKKKLAEAETNLAELHATKQRLVTEFSQGAGEAAALQKDPDNYMKYTLQAVMPKFLLMIGTGIKKLVTLEQEGLEVSAGLRGGRLEVKAGIERILVRDEVANSPVFPNIIQTGQMTATFAERPNNLTEITLKADRLFAIANLPCFLAILQALHFSIATQFDLDYYRQAAGEKVAAYVNKGQRYMEDLIRSGSRQAVVIEVEMWAPCAIIPINVMEPKECLIVDLGMVTVGTKLSSEKRDSGHFSSLTDERTIYDFYHILATDAKTGVLWEFDRVERWRDGRFSPLFQPSELDLEVGKSISKDQVRFPSLLAKVSIAELTFFLSDQQLLFLLRLKDRVEEQFEEGMAVRDKSEKDEEGVKETQPEGRGEGGSGFSMHFDVTLEKLSLRVEQGGVPLIEASVISVMALATMSVSGSLLVDFQIHKTAILDCRQGVAFPSALSKPHIGLTTAFDIGADPQYWYHDRKVATGERLETESQLCMRVKIVSGEETLEVLISLCNIRLALTSDLAAALLRLPFEAMKAASEDKARRKAVKELSPLRLLSRGISYKLGAPMKSPKETQSSVFGRHALATVLVQEVELWVPESSFDPKAKIVCMCIDSTVRYTSSRVITEYKDGKGGVVRMEVVEIDDEASVEINKVGVFSGLLRGNQVVRAMEEKEDILQPSRMDVEYSCVKSDGPQKITVELSFEALDAVVGFRDIVFLKGLYEQWMKVLPLLQSAAPQITLQRTVSQIESPAFQQASKPLQSDELHVRIKLSSLEATVVDDTSDRLLQLFFLNLMNVSSTFVYSEDILSVNFSSGIKLNYFNVLAACWEPLLEEWVVEVDAKQPDIRTPVEIFVQSSSLLNINLSYLMGETVSHVLSKLNESSDMWTKESVRINLDSSLITGNQVVYRLRNRLGTGVRAWIEGCAEDKREIWAISAGKYHRFSQNQLDKVRRGDSAGGRWKYASLLLTAQTASSIAIEIDTFGVISNVIVDELVTKSFVIDGNKSGDSTTIVIDISVKNGERVISLESLTKVLNNTQASIEITHRGRKVEVSAGKGFALPLTWLMTDNPTMLTTQTGEMDLLNSSGIVDLGGTTKVAIDSALVLSGVVDEDGVVRVPHQKVIIVNTPFTVHNVTPGVLSLYCENEAEPVCSLAPGEMKPIMIGDITKKVKHKWVVQLDNTKKVETEYELSLKAVEQRKLVGDIPADKLSIEFSPMSFVKSSNFDLSFKPLSNEIWNGTVVQVFFPFLVVNRTPFPLDFRSKDGHITLPSQSIGTVKDQKSQMTVRIAASQLGAASEWSKPFNMRTVGIAGSLQMNMGEGAPNVVQLGVKLENAEWPLIRTVIVKVQPRFILGNYLDFPIYVRQEKKGSAMKLSSGETVPYQLENAKVGRGVEISVDMENWSSPFNIEDIDDLQVRFRSNLAASESPPVLSAKFLSVRNPQTWFRPSPDNDFFHYVRVIIATEDEATLFVSLMNPIDPEYVISNMTGSEVTACQVECSVVTRVKARSRAYFAYDNHLAASKKVRFQLADQTQVYSLDNFKESKRRLASNIVRVIAEGVTRVISIEPDTQPVDEGLGESRYTTYVGSQYRFSNIKAKIAFSGCVVSLMDDQPCERFVFSLTGVDLKAFQTVEPKSMSYQVNQGIKIHIMNVQLDDMQAKGPHFPVILGQFAVVQEPGQENVPFFQFRLEKSSTKAVEGEQSLGSVEHFKHVGLLMQPVQLQIHQETVMGLLGVTTRLQKAFMKKDAFWKADTLESINFREVCPALDPSYPTLPYSASQISAKAYFQLVNLNAMKFIVSFRSSSKKTTLKIDPREAFGVVSVFNTVGRSFINISDSPLHFTNIILLHSFQTMQAMTWTIAKNYIRQGALQFYKIIGSSDMIGNPIGLIDKLGTGVFEFFNEPRKGLLKGPKEFATGLGKGVKSLVSGVVSGGFGSVSRITGSLYSVVRQVGGDENSYDRINRNDTATQGIYHGFKGGVQDLAEGVSGLFTKPFRGAKAGGVKGFFKGVGSGLIGVVTAPLSAVLRVGTSVTSGIANSATFLRTGKIQQKGRIRFPRPLGARKILEPYNEELAQAQEFLRTLKTHMTEQLIFYLRLDQRTIVIITTESALEIVDGDVRATVKLQDIEICQVHCVQKGFILIVGGGEGRLAVKAKDYAGLARLFGVFTMNSGKIDSKKQIPKLVKVRSERDRCC